jgi:Putative transposase/Transposase zinc-binding domain
MAEWQWKRWAAHVSPIVAAVDVRTDGVGLPSFVTKEFCKFLRCGVLVHGFARVRCGDCAFERLIPFSCKGRGCCPSGGGRRMAEHAAHLVDHVFPVDVPVRQWVLSVPHRLRYRLAYDQGLCRAVLAVYVRALGTFYRQRARRAGVAGGRTGTVTGLQRFGGSVNLHLHFHTLVLDGVFALGAGHQTVSHPAAPPTDAETARVTARVRRRIEALLVRRGIATGETDDGADPLADESAALAGLTAAAVRGRTALGRRAGRGPLRIGADPDAPWVERQGPLQAHDAGYDLHAAVAVRADDRTGLERLARYVFRPPLGQHRLRHLPDGRIAVALQRECRRHDPPGVPTRGTPRTAGHPGAPASRQLVDLPMESSRRTGSGAALSCPTRCPCRALTSTPTKQPRPRLLPALELPQTRSRNRRRSPRAVRGRSIGRGPI